MFFEDAAARLGLIVAFVGIFLRINLKILRADASRLSSGLPVRADAEAGWRAAFLGAAVATVIFLAAKPLFLGYIQMLAGHNVVYGSLAGCDLGLGGGYNRACLADRLLPIASP